MVGSANLSFVICHLSSVIPASLRRAEGSLAALSAPRHTVSNSTTGTILIRRMLPFSYRQAQKTTVFGTELFKIWCLGFRMPRVRAAFSTQSLKMAGLVDFPWRSSKPGSTPNSLQTSLVVPDRRYGARPNLLTDQIGDPMFVLSGNRPPFHQKPGILPEQCF